MERDEEEGFWRDLVDEEAWKIEAGIECPRVIQHPGCEEKEAKEGKDKAKTNRRGGKAAKKPKEVRTRNAPKPLSLIHI